MSEHISGKNNNVSMSINRNINQSNDTQIRKDIIRIQFISFSESTGSRSYPMGLLYISAYLKKHNFRNVEYLDYICVLRDPKNRDNHKEVVRRLLSYLDERNPHLIFIGPITSMNLVELIHLAPKLRERYPKSIILAGGPHFGKNHQIDKELLLKYCKELDGVIVGEAEETVLEITEVFYLEFKKNKTIPPRKKFEEKLREIPGVLTKNGTFKERKPPEDIDNLPFPDMELIEEYWKNSKIPKPKGYLSPSDYYSLSERRNPVVLSSLEYFEGDVDWGSFFYDKHYFDEHIHPEGYFPFGVIVGSRCCPFNCIFCCSSGKRRLHSAKYIFKDMVELYEKYKINLFVFFDPLFTTASSKEQHRIEELCNLLLKENYNFNYIIDIRPDIVLNLPEKLLIKMIKSGCTQFNLGLEKGSNQTLKRIRKGITIEEHKKSIKKLRNASQKAGKNILINGTFILGGPQETKEDVRDTLMHGFSLDLDGLIFYPLEIHPGTQVYEEAIQEGILEEGLRPYLDVNTYPIYATNILPKEYLFHVKDLSNRTIKLLTELKHTIRLVEHQLQEREHKPAAIEGYRMGSLFKYIRRFIHKALLYIKTHPNESILKNREHISSTVFVLGKDEGYYIEVKDLKIISPLKKFVDDVNTQIKRMEDALFKERGNYSDNAIDYHRGELALKWRKFIMQFDFLFLEVMK